MPCTPYSPAVGLFDNSLGWGTTNTSPWSFALRSGSTDTYQLKKSGTVVDELWIPGAAAVRWIFFPATNFLAVRNAVTSGGFDTYSIWIFDLRGTTVTHYAVGGGPWVLDAGRQLHFHTSADGMAFFMFAADSLPNSTKQHIVFRSDTGAQLCSWGPISTSGPTQRLAEITSARTVRIMTSPGSGGPTVWRECPLPSGSCDVQPNSQTFPEAVIGGPPALATTTREFTIRNSGDDCLRIVSIANDLPFSVTATSRPLPTTLGVGETVSVTVTFAPTAIGPSGTKNLVVTHEPAAGESTMTCSGTARAPVRRLTLSPTALSFGKHPVGSSPPLTLRLRNDGEVQLSVNVAAPPAGVPFAWAAYSGDIAVGSSHDIEVRFVPTSEGPASATLTVNETTGGTTHNASLSGTGCVANAEIVTPPAPFPSFGQVQRGFRMVRFITITNTGDGTLTFTARIDGVDRALYGLMQDPPADSVIDVVSARTYSVNAVDPCGSGPAGTGQTNIAVVFFADDAPRVTSAQLIIEGHNATNPVPASFTYALTGEITAPIAVDAGLVLDRSGSMSQTIGTRTKADAAIAGGRLFAELIRPDLDDRITIVKYDEIIDVLQPVVQVTSANKPGIVAKINPTELAPRGTTCIAGGVHVAAGQLSVPRTSPPPALTKAMVVLTDGMDNTGYLNPDDSQWYSILGGNSWHPSGSGGVATRPLTLPSDIKIYGIGLGRGEDIDRAALNRLSTATGAYSGVVGDLVGPTYFNLEKYFAQVYMDMAGVAIISDPVYTILPGQKQRIEFDVLRGDVGALVVLFDHEGMRLPFKIVSPKGEVFNGPSIPPGFQMRVGSSPTARFVEFVMPAREPDRYAGRWAVIVEHQGYACSGDLPAGKDTREMREGFLPNKCQSNKSPVDYGISIGVGSNFRMQPYVTPAPVHMGEPILLTAVVTEAGLPVTGCTVTVRAVAPSGATWNLTLLDDGAHDDSDRNDGEYARLFTNTAEGGTYEFTFRAVGMSRDGQPVVREAVRAKYVEGRIPIEPNGGRPGEPDLCCQEIIKMLHRVLEKR
ncbi:MAG: choice-of-anchor D domain-containing protein [Bacillota bacterium]